MKDEATSVVRGDRVIHRPWLRRWYLATESSIYYGCASGARSRIKMATDVAAAEGGELMDDGGSGTMTSPVM